MTEAMSTSYLITGGNRGLGKGLVATYLARPNNVVIAAVRDPNHATSRALHDLPKGPSSFLIIVKIDSSSESDAARAVEELQSVHDVSALNVVIANAGIAKIFPTVAQAQASDMLEHFQVNVVAVALLFGAVKPLLDRSEKPPKFVTLGTGAATIGAMEQVPVPNAVYGPSKAALNWITKKIHLENPGMIAFPVHPGFAQTDTGNESAKAFGLEQAEIPVEQSVTGLVDVIDGATREKTSGKFMTYTGDEFPW